MYTTYTGPGIYRLRLGQHTYIGSAANVAKRLKAHETAAKRGAEPVKLQRAYDETGEMHAEIVQEMKDSTTRLELLSAEREWIQKERPDLNEAPIMLNEVEGSILGFMKYERQELLAVENAATEREKIKHQNWADFWTRAIEDHKERYFTPLGGGELASNKESVRKYQAGRDAIMLRPSLEDGKAIRAAAAAAGTSLQSFVLSTVQARMNGELVKLEPAEETHRKSHGVKLEPEAIQAAQAAAELTGETVPEYIGRAINDTAARDAQLRAIGFQQQFLKHKTDQ